MSEQPYVSHSDSWESTATIRNRPRRVIEDDNLRYYPMNRQPLCTHPVIVQLDQKVQDLILVQSLYKYINDIIIFETEIVNKTAREIAKGNFPFLFPFDCRYDAMSVVIDEDYHAYVAMNYMHQVQERTGIAPIELPSEIELSRAIPRALCTLAPQYQAGMELIAVAISENTVTAEVAAFSKDPSLKRSVKGLMVDHLADEGRHSIFWINLVKHYWANIDEEARIVIGGAIPGFIEAYLTNEIQMLFDHRLVESLDISEVLMEKIREDIPTSYPITKNHPMIANIRNFLKRSGLSQHEATRTGLSRYF
ncbi:MAG: diiron oxygenase [Gammaproteobacteria bacterium]|nr:diiron oxygenase [Gammaproteobacteria bacterium]